MATAYTNFAHQAYFLQARTDSAGADVDDATGEDFRLLLELYTGGIVPKVGNADAFKVKQRGAGANLSVDVGSGNADADLAIVEGLSSGQGNYLARSVPTVTNVLVPTADLSNPRLDGVYLVFRDNVYDGGSGRVLPQLAYRDGTPASSPVAPGPDGTWEAFLDLATVSVPNGDTAVTDNQITDNRVLARSLAGGGTPGVVEMYGGAIPPGGALLCNGQAVSRSAFGRLFAVIGTVWGVGDGSTTFNVPDMRGRYPRGVATSGDGDALGESFGADTLPNHVHPVDPPSTVSGNNSASEVVGVSTGPSDAETVADHPHTHSTNIAQFNSGNPTTSPSILPASRAIHYIIWT